MITATQLREEYFISYKIRTYVETVAEKFIKEAASNGESFVYLDSKVFPHLRISYREFITTYPDYTDIGLCDSWFWWRDHSLPLSHSLALYIYVVLSEYGYNCQILYPGFENQYSSGTFTVKVTLSLDPDKDELEGVKDAMAQFETLRFLEDFFEDYSLARLYHISLPISLPAKKKRRKTKGDKI